MITENINAKTVTQKVIKLLEKDGYQVPDFGRKMITEAAENIDAAKNRSHKNEEHLFDPKKIVMIQFCEFQIELEKMFGLEVTEKEVEELWYRMFDQILCDDAFIYVIKCLQKPWNHLAQNCTFEIAYYDEDEGYKPGTAS